MSLNIELKPVTSLDDVLSLATVNERALDGDPLKEWMRLFTERTELEGAKTAITESLDDPTYKIIKAVIPDPDSPLNEKIIGFVHWMCGYILLDKVDPFAEKSVPEPATAPVADVRDVASNLAENLSETANKLEESPSKTREDADRAKRLRAGEAKYIATRNHYIAAIRGKKHMFIRRIMVLPEYQGHGIGSKLMKIVTDEADHQKIVCWLFARPAGMKLYERVGFKSMGITEMDEKEWNFVCSPATSMMRLPQSLRS